MSGSRFGVLILGVVTATTLVGCGPTKVPHNDLVEGTLKLDDQPLGGVVVTFVPEDNGTKAMVPSRATTDDQGRFKLVCENQKPGAVVAKHKVIVTRGRAADRGHGEQAQEPISKDQRPVPAAYTAAAKTPLDTTVTADKHSGYDFNLKSTQQ
jgi:hypothetical protein